LQFLTLHEPNAKTFKAVIALPVNSTTPEVLAGVLRVWARPAAVTLALSN
jgi:hypothetical protein